MPNPAPALWGFPLGSRSNQEDKVGVFVPGDIKAFGADPRTCGSSSLISPLKFTWAAASHHTLELPSPPQSTDLPGSAKPMASRGTPAPSPHSPISASLEDVDLWTEFYRVGTEMVITKSGRRMFPQCKIRLSGLVPYLKYVVLVDFVSVDNFRYKWAKDQWEVAGKAEPQLPGRSYIHPDSPAYGSHWMKEPVSFHKMKLTNNTLDQHGHIILHSMHRYQPRFLVVQADDLFNVCWNLFQVFSFPQTVFISVTAYQNEQITKLKIDNNPFAKGFREQGRKPRRLSPGQGPKKERLGELVNSPESEQSGLTKEDAEEQAEARGGSGPVNGSRFSLLWGPCGMTGTEGPPGEAAGTGPGPYPAYRFQDFSPGLWEAVPGSDRRPQPGPAGAEPEVRQLPDKAGPHGPLYSAYGPEAGPGPWLVPAPGQPRPFPPLDGASTDWGQCPIFSYACCPPPPPPARSVADNKNCLLSDGVASVGRDPGTAPARPRAAGNGPASCWPRAPPTRCETREPTRGGKRHREPGGAATGPERTLGSGASVRRQTEGACRVSEGEGAEGSPQPGTAPQASRRDPTALSELTLRVRMRAPVCPALPSGTAQPLGRPLGSCGEEPLRCSLSAAPTPAPSSRLPSWRPAGNGPPRSGRSEVPPPAGGLTPGPERRGGQRSALCAQEPPHPHPKMEAAARQGRPVPRLPSPLPATPGGPEHPVAGIRGWASRTSQPGFVARRLRQAAAFCAPPGGRGHSLSDRETRGQSFGSALPPPWRGAFAGPQSSCFPNMCFLVEGSPSGGTEGTPGGSWEEEAHQEKSKGPEPENPAVSIRPECHGRRWTVGEGGGLAGKHTEEEDQEEEAPETGP
ncbi:T-box transcription factor TBX2-like [Gracilinanus agilis]|uniref:T-box transcription factor TBX2-like n=1 Tax=Gracilinanus agilis TaxID=191870 RepID=UPI001CFDF401|nr:T-box transcription factor TBX2-like [Gracilinanus agilis]